MRQPIALLLAIMLAGTMAHAYEITITDDPGGQLGTFTQKYLDMAYYGDRIRIAGPCESACALFTGIVPPERVCVTAGAKLGFHSASIGPHGAYSAFGTRYMWQTYSPAVRALVRKQGWNGLSPHPRMIYIKGRELRSLFRAC